MMFRPFRQKNGFINMKKFLVIFLILSALTTYKSAFAVEQEVLFEGDKSWDGKRVSLPKRKAEVVSVLLKIKPGEKMKWHCHPFPTTGYMLSGELEVEKKNGEKRIIKKGESLFEVSNTWHRGRNMSRIWPVKIVVFYIGTKDHKATTILYNKKNKNKCNN